MRALAVTAALAAGTLTAALLGGCGINTQNAGSPTITTPTGTSSASTPSAATKRLPKRPPGVVAVEGPRGSITGLVRNPSGVNVSFANVTEGTGVADLCAGRIDVLDISRQLTPGELNRCKRNGVELADQPLLVASDAIVLATRNEHDVGGDCLQLSTANAIFRAGSTIDNWDQVGFFDIPLYVTGREDASPEFQAFAALVLHVPVNASLADVRGDYLVHTTDDGVRREVTNATRRDRILGRFAVRLRALRLARQLAFQTTVQDAVRRAKNRMLAIFDQENRQRAATKVVLTSEQKLLIQRDNLRRITAAQNAAAARAARNFTYPRLTFLRRRIRRLLANATHSGTIGIFHFSYYELFENQLRPMEIWDPATSRAILSQAKNVTVTPATGRGASRATKIPGTGKSIVNPKTAPWCVFPSQTTITNGSYPLARRFFLYVSKLNLRRPEVKAFLRGYLAQAQKLATASRLVAIDDLTLAQNQSLIEHNGTFVPLPANTTTVQSGAPAPAPAVPAPTATTQTVPGVSGAASSTGP